jgi:hypothetical protein
MSGASDKQQSKAMPPWVAVVTSVVISYGGVWSGVVPLPNGAVASGAASIESVAALRVDIATQQALQTGTDAAVHGLREEVRDFGGQLADLRADVAGLRGELNRLAKIGVVKTEAAKVTVLEDPPKGG